MFVIWVEPLAGISHASSARGFNRCALLLCCLHYKQWQVPGVCRCRLEITAKMLECGDVVDAAPEAEAIADIEAGLSTCAPQPTQQRRAAHRSHNASHVSATPADEPQNAQALRAPSIQSLTVPQDSASCLPQQRHVVQQQTIV